MSQFRQRATHEVLLIKIELDSWRTTSVVSHSCPRHALLVRPSVLLVVILVILALSRRHPRAHRLQELPDTSQ
jgi:hypothetical protein